MIEAMIIVMRAMMKFMSTVCLKMMGNCMVVLMKCLDMNLEYESWDDGGANSSFDSKMGTYGPSQSRLIIVIMGKSCDDQGKVKLVTGMIFGNVEKFRKVLKEFSIQ